MKVGDFVYNRYFTKPKTRRITGISDFTIHSEMYLPDTKTWLPCPDTLMEQLLPIESRWPPGAVLLHKNGTIATIACPLPGHYKGYHMNDGSIFYTDDIACMMCN